jgi:hypothetical protein
MLVPDLLMRVIIFTHTLERLGCQRQLKISEEIIWQDRLDHATFPVTNDGADQGGLTVFSGPGGASIAPGAEGLILLWLIR